MCAFGRLPVRPLHGRAVRILRHAQDLVGIHATVLRTNSPHHASRSVGLRAPPTCKFIDPSRVCTQAATAVGGDFQHAKLKSGFMCTKRQFAQAIASASIGAERRAAAACAESSLIPAATLDSDMVWPQ